MASDDLRARIAEALDGAFTTLEDFDAETAADAVLALMQPELDRLTTERDHWEHAAAENGQLYAACENQRDEARVERDRLRAGIPLVCSDERHAAKVAALETALAEWRAAAYKATAERDHLASACRTMRRRLTVLGAALPPGMEFYVGKIKAMRVFLANAVADIPTTTEGARDVSL